MSVTIGIRVVKMGFMRMAGRIMNVTRWVMTVAGGVMTVAVVVMSVKMRIMSIKMKIMTVKREIMTMKMEIMTVKMWGFSKKVQKLNGEKNLSNYFLTKQQKKWQHKMNHDQCRNTMSLWQYCMPH